MNQHFKARTRSEKVWNSRKLLCSMDLTYQEGGWCWISSSVMELKIFWENLLVEDNQRSRRPSFSSRDLLVFSYLCCWYRLCFCVWQQSSSFCGSLLARFLKIFYGLRGVWACLISFVTRRVLDEQSRAIDWHPVPRVPFSRWFYIA